VSRISSEDRLLNPLKVTYRLYEWAHACPRGGEEGDRTVGGGNSGIPQFLRGTPDTMINTTIMLQRVH
jgi:hypothetical protein